MKRVLHVYSGNLYGGIERVLSTMASEGKRVPELEQEFALCFRGRLWDELLAVDAPVYDLGRVRISRPWTVWRARKRLSRLLLDRKYDAVITHACWSHAIFASTVRKKRLKLINSIHDVLTRKNMIERWASRTEPDLAIANSSFTAAAVSTVFPNTNTDVIYLPVSAPAIEDRERIRSEVRSEFAVTSDNVVILQASRLERWKGQAVHIEALGQLRDIPNWQAWFAGGVQKRGEAEFLDELKGSARRLGIEDRVKFLGQRSDVENLMAAADIYCQPNTGPEPFGIAYVEALYAGLPVIASAMGGALEIVDESCGFTVPPGNSSAVASALRNLIQDPDRRKKLSVHCPSRAVELCNPSRYLNALTDRCFQGMG